MIVKNKQKVNKTKNIIRSDKQDAIAYLKSNKIVYINNIKSICHP